MRSVSLGAVFFLAALLAALHIVGIEQSLYWNLWWYDIPMHALGGAVAASAYLWSARYAVPLVPRGFSHVFLFVLGVGIAWEAFEYLAGLYPADVPSALHELDTVLDIAFDMGGATIAYMAFLRFFSHG